LWLEQAGVPLPWGALESSILTAFFMLFLLGVFLGRISRKFWLWSGLQTLLIAVLTAGIILLIG
ncbi:MAG: hypothetical protein PVG66_13635, partial [Chromatiales bacterium]|jgi:VIT1/CCC1 family predicted Fe2+/Mn2+ transporter